MTILFHLKNTKQKKIRVFLNFATKKKIKEKPTINGHKRKKSQDTEIIQLALAALLFAFA